MKKYLILVLVVGCIGFHVDGAYTNSSRGNDKRKLMYLQIVSTNGFYAPLELYPNDLNTAEDWPEGLGALTKLGKLQQFELGKFLREYYKSFITSNPEEIDAFSSAEDRSTYSILTLLASLNAPTPEWEFVPGFRWQPPTISYREENDVFFKYNDSCLNQLLDSEIRFRQYHGARDMDLYSFWEQNSGYELLSWREVALLHDIIEKEMQTGLKVPWWAEKHLTDMKRIANAAFEQNYNSTLSLKLKVGKLIDLLTVRMRVKMLPNDPSTKIKVSVYMTHDWNMAALLTALGQFNGIQPPPCTTVNFELYQDAGDYTVRLLLFNSTSPELGKQPAHVLTLKGCSEFCPLSKFVEFVQFLFPVRYNHNCGHAIIWVDSSKSLEKPKETLYDQLKALTEEDSVLSRSN